MSRFPGSTKRLQGLRHHRRSSAFAAHRRLHDVRRHLQTVEQTRHGVVRFASPANVLRVVRQVPAGCDDFRAQREPCITVQPTDGGPSVQKWNRSLFAVKSDRCGGDEGIKCWFYSIWNYIFFRKPKWNRIQNVCRVRLFSIKSKGEQYCL